MGISDAEEGVDGIPFQSSHDLEVAFIQPLGFLPYLKIEHKRSHPRFNPLVNWRNAYYHCNPGFDDIEETATCSFFTS